MEEPVQQGAAGSTTADNAPSAVFEGETPAELYGSGLSGRLGSLGNEHHQHMVGG